MNREQRICWFWKLDTLLNNREFIITKIKFIGQYPVINQFDYVRQALAT